MKHKYQLCEANSMLKTEWNQYLQKKGISSGLNCFEWSFILSSAYGPIQKYFYAKDNSDRIVGVLPTYITVDLKRHEQLFSNRQGLVADNCQVAELLVNAAHDFAKERAVSKAEITSGLQKFDLNFFRSEKSTIQIDLSVSIEVLWKSMRDKTRNAIRKGEKCNLIIQEGSHLLPIFYRLYSVRMISKSVYLLTYRFFESIIKYFGKQCEIHVAYHNGEAIAAMLIIYFGTVAVYSYGGMLPGYEKYCANHYLLWKIIKQCYDRGINVLDLGESSPNSGVYKFKIWFGGSPKTVYYYDLLKKDNSLDLPLNQKGSIREKIYYTGVGLAPKWLKKILLIKLRQHNRLI